MQFISQLLEHPALLAYFSGANNYTWLQFRNGERRLLAKPLTYFEERLPAFLRIHKTALINPGCVVSIHPPQRAKMPGSVRMHDGTELPVSRRRWPYISQIFDNQSPTDSLTEKFTTLSGLDSRAECKPQAMAPVSVVAVMTGDALLLTRQRIEALGIHCQLQAVEWGAELANVLLTHPADEWPSLILLDGRENRPDRMLTLQRLKSDYRLRAIPAVWLASPGDNPIPAYELDVNSVIEVANTPTSFVETIDQLCQYWLMLVQLPQETDAQAV